MKTLDLFKRVFSYSTKQECERVILFALSAIESLSIIQATREVTDAIKYLQANLAVAEKWYETNYGIPEF